MAQIAEIIKYEGDNSTFIWKHPLEDFNSLTQLIVHESQEAIFFMNGQALDLFGPGRYTLETQNIPKIGKLLNRTTGGETPFHCEVYFINKTVQMAIKWGTDSPVRFLEPTYGVPLAIGASGEMNLMVSDSRKLLVKLVGTMNGIAWDNQQVRDNQRNEFTQSLRDSFRPLITTAVKTNLSDCIKKQNINILEIDQNLGLLSDQLKHAILPGFEEYGLTIPEFYVTTVVLPESDPNFARIRHLYSIALQQKMIEAEAAIETSKIEAKTTIGTAEAQSQAAIIAAETSVIEAQAAVTAAETSVIEAEASVAAAKRQVVIEEEETITEQARRSAERELIQAQAKAEAYKAQAFAEAEEMRAKGYTYQQETARQVGLEAMQNGITGNGSGGAGSSLGDLAGLGVTLGAMGGVIGMTKEAMNPIMQTSADIGSGVVASVGNTWNCACGKTAISSKFCPDCGATKPEPKIGWHCTCGLKNITSNFCPECGNKKPEATTWDCSCGCKGISSNFCPECGNKKP